MLNRLILLFIAGVVAFCSNSQALTLNDYIAQVTGQNDSARASQLSARGSMLRKEEGSLPFKTNLYANADYSDDQRLTGAPVFQGKQTMVRRYEAGFSQRFRFGLDASLGYLQQHTSIQGVSPSLVRFSDYFDQQFRLTLTQSLWRNWLGKEFQSQERAQVEAAKALSYSEQFKLRLLEADARVAYWTLLQARANVIVQQDAVERAQKIRESNKRKTERQLTDKIDLLQSDANVEFRQLQLRQAQQDLTRTARAFNLLRNVEGEEVETELTSVLTKIEIENLSVPTKGEMREDVKAALAQSLAEKAQAEAAAELSKPRFEVYAQLSTNGKDNNWSKSYQQINTNVYTQNAVGLRFTAPLDVASLDNNRTGRGMEAQAAELRYKRKVFEVDREWVDTLTRYNDAKERLVLARKIEEAQKAKTTHERSRLGQGLTTTFQTLTFEQDYADAQLNRLRAETELLSLHARLQVFATN